MCSHAHIEISYRKRRNNEEDVAVSD